MADVKNLVPKIEAIEWDGTNLAQFTDRFPASPGNTYWAASEEDGLLVITQVDDPGNATYPQPGLTVGQCVVVAAGGSLMDMGNWADFAHKYTEVPPMPVPPEA